MKQEASSLTAVDKPLIVGGNKKTNHLSTTQAVQLQPAKRLTMTFGALPIPIKSAVRKVL